MSKKIRLTPTTQKILDSCRKAGYPVGIPELCVSTGSTATVVLRGCQRLLDLCLLSEYGVGAEPSRYYALPPNPSGWLAA